ncbi:SAM-dependent methyltransferase [Actinomadura madurae]|uniref:SAM-dependent methyltransferase n=1 Tax=Actinomadura madurae TaxID=1993 RepID=UPI00202748D6|nr:SAM-dependent methyltransferase [Actinomadura madurae]URN08815.1 SAM-dependent methyltransferase [Actinomadura madurae]
MDEQYGPELPSIPGVDPEVPNSARVWDYWLGGDEFYPADKAMADEIERVLPDIVDQARADRLFLRRVVEFFAGEAGIDQFLDIGTGLPTSNNTHEVAQRLRPDARVVYVDNDPLVLAHARALLTSTPEGVTAYLDADMHDPDGILDLAARTLDFGRPVAVTMLGVVWHIVEDDDAVRILGRLMERTAPGSHLAISHQTDEVTGQQARDAVEMWNRDAAPKGVCRSRRQMETLFTEIGLDLLEPGVVSCNWWRPEVPDMLPAAVDQFGGVGLKH